MTRLLYQLIIESKPMPRFHTMTQAEAREMNDGLAGTPGPAVRWEPVETPRPDFQYLENPPDLAAVPKYAFIKYNRQLLRCLPGPDDRISLVVPYSGDVLRLRDYLKAQRDNSPDDFRRWDEIDEYYTRLCMRGGEPAMIGAGHD